MILFLDMVNDSMVYPIKNPPSLWDGGFFLIEVKNFGMRRPYM
jgi:hypothetical protein